MPNSVDFYKGIFLHVIPVRIIVPWSNLPKQTGSEECAHSTTFVTRVRIPSIKQIRASYRKALDTGRQGGGVRIVAIFYDLCSDIWSESPVTDSIQDGLETVESLKISVDEDIDPQRASKENNDVELGEEGDFGDEAITVVSATFGITSSATSSVPIQQNVPSTSTPIQPSPSESS